MICCQRIAVKVVVGSVEGVIGSVWWSAEDVSAICCDSATSICRGAVETIWVLVCCCEFPSEIVLFLLVGSASVSCISEEFRELVG